MEGKEGFDALDDLLAEFDEPAEPEASPDMNEDFNALNDLLEGLNVELGFGDQLEKEKEMLPFKVRAIQDHSPNEGTFL